MIAKGNIFGALPSVIDRSVTMNTTIKLQKNGPIIIDGEFQLVDADGKDWDAQGRMKITLCRCGHSKQKPFCDGSHKKMEFSDEVTAI